VARRKKGKHKGRRRDDKEEQKYSLEEIARNKELISQLLSKTQSGQHTAGLPKEQLEALTKEPILPPNCRSLAGSKRHPLSREQKHSREVQALLLMDGILNQTSNYTTQQKIVDFAQVSLSHTLDRQCHSQCPPIACRLQASMEEAQGEDPEFVH